MRLNLFEIIKYNFSFSKKGFLVTLHQVVLIETVHTLTNSFLGNTETSKNDVFSMLRS